MDVQYSQVFFPSSLPELFPDWSRFPEAKLYAGGTSYIYGQSSSAIELPVNIISLERLEELKRISRTERYLEIGAAVELNEILKLGKIVPKALRDVIRQAANPMIRNMATVGGSICYPGGRLDIAGPLIALDARYELRGASETRWIAASRFTPDGPEKTLAGQELLSRIRVPLESWDYSVFHKFGERFGAPDTGVIVLLARTEKDILSELRLVFAGDFLVREKESELLLTGKRLPLERKAAGAFVERWKESLSGIENRDEMLCFSMTNFIESAILTLTG